jgi:hypothetical protein
MTESYYPEMPAPSLAAIRLIQKKLSEDPSYLSSPDCPYPEEFCDIFATPAVRAAPAGEEQRPAPPAVVGDKWAKLELESQELFDELKNYGDTLKDVEGGVDSTEKMAYFRTATALLEKIVSIHERAANLKNLHHFQETILGILEDLMPADKRTEFMNRIKAIMEAENGKA